jgi:hypothetical protein
MRTAYGAASSYSSKGQILETSTSAKLWGKTVTGSIKLRRNASFATTLKLTIQKSATVDASSAATWSDIGSATAANASLPTGTTSADWYSLSATVAIPNDGTANSIRFLISEGAAGASGAYWEMAQAQLEAGSVVTPFQTASGSIGGELALCQRYYYRAVIDAVGGRLGSGFVNSIIELNLTVPFPVPMRTKPSALEQTGTATDYQVLTSGNTITTCNTVPVISTSTQAMQGVVSLTTAGTLVAGQAGTMRVATANAYLGWSAEL